MHMRPNWSASQYGRQENLIKAEQYLFSNEKIEYILAGSSLSNYINLSHLPGVYNLAFSGQSIFDALDIILLKDGNDLKIVFVEMNVVTRPGDPKFIKEVAFPLKIWLKKNFEALREDKQPLGILANYFSGKLLPGPLKIKNKLIAFIKKHRTQQLGRNDLKIIDAVLADRNFEEIERFNKLLVVQLKDYNKTPTDKDLKALFDSLLNKVRLLENRGVKVIFYEMPVHQELCNKPKPILIRSWFYSYFSRKDYKYIEIPQCNLYKTYDGIHLKPEDSEIYSKFLHSKIFDFL